MGNGVPAVRPLLTITGLSKVFPGQVALDGVDLELAAGRTRALVGQNGSGKSTLIKVLAGYHAPTQLDSVILHTNSGDVALDLGDPQASGEAGIRFVHQDLALVDTLSALENIALGSGFVLRSGLIDWKREAARARTDLGELGFAGFSLTTPVGQLSPAQRTIVALARAMRGWRDGASLLVLDEPTASLPYDDVEQLFDGIRRLKERGVAILYVSHHLDEVFEIADEVTVFRDGRVVTTEPVDALDHDRLIELMIGHKLETRASRSDDRQPGCAADGHRTDRRLRAGRDPRRGRRRGGRRGRHLRIGSRPSDPVDHGADPLSERRGVDQRDIDPAVRSGSGDRRRGGLRVQRTELGWGTCPPCP